MTRDEIVQALKQDRTNLLEAIEGIPPDQMATRPVMEWWTIKDLLGHMAMWQQVALKFVVDYRTSGVPRSLGLTDDAAVDRYNRRGIALRRDWPLPRVLAELEMAQQYLLTAVEALSDEDASKPLPAPWHAATTLEQLIAINSYTHDPEHIQQIRKWRVEQAAAQR